MYTLWFCFWGWLIPAEIFWWSNVADTPHCLDLTTKILEGWIMAAFCIVIPAPIIFTVWIIIDIIQQRRIKRSI